MQLFYHGTRDIELPAATRRQPPSRASRHCEACGRALAATEASQGGQGLAFCADCRDRLDRSAIQIHFCDACGVSVPIDAVQAGTALTADGRILCLACRLPRAARRSPVPWAVAAALAALLAGVLLAWLL